MTRKPDGCTRRAYTSGWCTTHYRRWHSGQPMDAPIRRYVQHEDGARATRNPLGTKPVLRKREKPFAAEYALLAELGLDRSASAELRRADRSAPCCPSGLGRPVRLASP
jgi:hypothetical protein